MLKVFSCSKSIDTGKFIVNKLNGDQNEYKCITFSDGEMEVHFETSVRGDDVFLIQSITSSDALVELLLAINAAKLASAKSVTAVIPYLGYARQDRKSRPRVSLGAKVVLQAIESVGADRIITMDLHAPQEVGFVNIPVDHLHASSIFIPYLRDKITGTTVLVAPDAGAAKNVALYSKELQLPMVLCHKSRSGVNNVDDISVIGDVSGKEVIIIDDMVDTAGTICKCSQLLKDKGASKVSIMFTHSVLSGQAGDRLINSCISEIITSNTISNNVLNNEFMKTMKVVEVMTITDLFAAAIRSAYNNESIEDLFTIKQ